ncbi:MAG TPA: class I SAM-dependent methyltransferase, partial [Candidatus Baltobacteraceae bacterium]
MFTDTWKKDYPEHAELASPPANSSLAMLIDLIGEGRRVLDVGCATGYLAKALASRGCDVVGIDINADALTESREFCSEAIAADLEVEPLGRILEGRARFDVAAFGDILEHLRNPLAVLESVRPLLAEGGFVVASIPNVAHAAVRLSLLGGRFDYQDFGLLDETHIRFFTRKSVEELFLVAGFRIEHMART